MTSKPVELAALAGLLLMLSTDAALSQAERRDSESAGRVLYAAPTRIMAVGAGVSILGAEGSVMGQVVRGKPYSGESVTESTQVLADGNRITHVNSARVYRDSEGRTRTEQTLNGVGVWHTGPEPVTIVTINDPVEGVSHVLQPETQTARQVMTRQARIRNGHIVLRGGAFAPASAAPAAPLGAAPAGPAEPGVQVHVATPSALFGVHESAMTEMIEDLGEQVLEAVVARGTRRTQTIPAGAIGNERPIEIVTEEWYSPDLQAIVLRHTTDPRFGETSYRLVNVVLGEPPEYLFEVPADYAVHEMASPPPDTLVATPARRATPDPER